VARRSIRPWQVTAVYNALLLGHGIDEAKRSGKVSRSTVLGWMAVGPSCAAPGLPKHLPLLLAVDRARQGRSLTDPLSDAEQVVATRLMLTSLESISRRFETIAQRLARAVTEASPAPTTTRGA
jgi:hypothetical protein